MKRLVLVLLFLLIPVPATQANSTITITEPTHRTADGVFINDELASSITAEGRLGKLLFKRSSAVTTYYIDVATIEEIQDLADGYSYINDQGEIIEIPEYVLANIWLNTLRSAVTKKQVYAIPYGNPDRAFLAAKAPAEYALLKRLASERLALFLTSEVESAESTISGESARGAARALSNIYRRELRVTYSAAPAVELLALRLQLAQLLNPELTKSDLAALIEPISEALAANSSKLRIAQGNYTITSSSYNLPVTVTNDFSVPVTLMLKVRPSNSRVVIGDITPISIPANSQVQAEVPIDVIASGETNLEMKLRSLNGKQVGSIEVIPLRLAVIPPVTTWFTTGMAIVLLLAAVVQSMRRVKKRKKL